MDGYVLIKRNIFEWCGKNARMAQFDNKPYSSREALMWLIMNTTYDSMTSADGIKTEAGEFCFTEEYLARTFNWGVDDRARKKAGRFLDRLVKTGTISKETIKNGRVKYRFKNWQKHQKMGKTDVQRNVQQNVQGLSNEMSNVCIDNQYSYEETCPTKCPTKRPVFDRSNVPIYNKGENSSPDGSSFSTLQKTNKETKTENNTPSLPLGGPGGAAVFPVFSEEKGQNPSGVYQPKPVEPTVYQTSQSFPLKEVKEPFTKEELLSVISSEPQIVQDELMKKYDIFRKKGWKTSKGEEVTLSFFTGFLRNDVRKSFNIQDGSLKYNEYDPKKIDVKNFWK